MPTRFNTVCTEEDLINVALPSKTVSYTPVPNSMIFDILHEELANNNLVVKNTDLTMSAGGRRFIGLYDIESEDKELGYRIGFKNSYDGTMAFGMGIGSVVWLCSNGMINGEIAERRIHRGNAEQDVQEIIKIGLQEYQTRHSENLRVKKELQEIYCSREDINRIVGKLFMTGALNGNEMVRAKKEIIASPLFNNLTTSPDGFSAWDLYNHQTEALKKASFNTYFEKHQAVHNLFVNEFGL